MTTVEQAVEYFPEETEVLEGNQTQGRFVHNKSHMNWSGWNQGLRGRKSTNNRLSYAAADIGTK
jgi:hypothetical protein